MAPCWYTKLAQYKKSSAQVNVRGAGADSDADAQRLAAPAHAARGPRAPHAPARLAVRARTAAAHAVRTPGLEPLAAGLTRRPVLTHAVFQGPQTEPAAARARSARLLRAPGAVSTSSASAATPYSILYLYIS